MELCRPTCKTSWVQSPLNLISLPQRMRRLKERLLRLLHSSKRRRLQWRLRLPRKRRPHLRRRSQCRRLLNSNLEVSKKKARLFCRRNCEFLGFYRGQEGEQECLHAELPWLFRLDDEFVFELTHLECGCTQVERKDAILCATEIRQIGSDVLNHQQHLTRFIFLAFLGSTLFC